MLHVARRRNEQCSQRSGFGEAREIETSRRFRGEYNGSENECQGVAPESSRQAVPILRTLRSPSDLGGLHIHDHNNQRHVLLQRYACKRLRLERKASRKASGLHNSWNSSSILRNCSRNDLRRPEIQIFPGGHSPLPPLWSHYTHIYALCVLQENPPANFCLHPWAGRHAYRQAKEQIERKTKRQTGRQIDEQTGGQTETAIPCPR